MKIRGLYSITLFAVFFLLIGIIVTFSIGQSQIKQLIPPNLSTRALSPTATRPSFCVPLPTEKQKTIRTPTPDQYTNKSSVAVNLASTTTHFPIKKSYDLDPSTRVEQKTSIIVFRCNGDWEEYWINPEKNLAEYIKFNEGDIVWLSSPPSELMGKKPPEPNRKITVGLSTTPTLKITPIFPYPLPATSQSKNQGYPVPLPTNP